MWQTCALLIALALAADPAAKAVAPLSGEAPRAFSCRAALVPEGRACAERCDRAYAAQAQAEAGWECVLACTRRTQHAIADCRSTPAPAAQTPLATR
jgi:hypothetical protein